MELHTFFFTDMHQFGASFAGYLALRKRLFVDRLGWQLAHDGRHEMDQYDHPLAGYSIVTVDGRVVAGGRVISCATDWMGWSYMLNDARREKIGFIPADLMTHYPQDPTVWECTRLVIDEEALSVTRRTLALKAVVYGLCLLADQRGATELISLSPVALGRMLRSMGYQARPCGRRYVGVEDSRSYQPFSMTCDTTVNQAICASMLRDTRARNHNDGLLQRLLKRAA